MARNDFSIRRKIQINQKLPGDLDNKLTSFQTHFYQPPVSLIRNGDHIRQCLSLEMVIISASVSH